MAYDQSMTSALVKNQFLLAMPNLLVAGDYFRDTITYVCDHNDKGAMGIVVNRPLKLTVADVLEQLELPNTDDVEAVVLEGGPVQRNAAIILHSDDVRIEKSVGVGDGLALTAEVEMLAAIGRGEGPSQYVVALGYAGWASGQLEGELAANTWLTCRGSKSLIFEVPFEERVGTAAKTLGIDFSLMSGQSGQRLNQGLGSDHGSERLLACRCLAQSFGCHRQVSHPNAGGSEYGVGKRCGRRSHGGLPGAARVESRVVQNDRFHGWNFAEAQDRIAVPIHAGRALGIESHRFLQAPGEGLHGAALELIDQAVMVHNPSGVGCDPHPFDRDGRVVRNGGFDHGRDTALLILVARDSHAARAVRAAGQVEDGVEHPHGARVVGQMTTPNLRWIDTRRERQFVHEGLDGEDVHLRPETAQRGGSQRRVRHRMADHPRLRKPVEGFGVAVHPGCRDRPGEGETGLEWLRQVPGSQQVHPRVCGGRPPAVGKAPDVVAPIQYATRCADIRCQVDAHRRTVGFERMFILAPPLQDDLASGQSSRNEGRIQCGIVGAVVPIASRTVDVSDGDVFGRHGKHAGDDPAQWLDALARAAYLQATIVESGGCGRWGERTVHDEWSGISLP